MAGFARWFPTTSRLRRLVGILEAVAPLALSLSRLKQATRLLGMAATMRVALSQPVLIPYFRERIERSLADADAGLGQSTFSEAWEVGGGPNIQQAIEEVKDVLAEARNAIGHN